MHVSPETGKSQPRDGHVGWCLDLMYLCYYPLFYVPAISQGAAPLFLCLLAGVWSRWAPGYRPWEQRKQSILRGKAEGIKVQQKIIYISTSMRKSPEISFLANSSGNQKRAGEMEGLTFDSWSIDRSQRICPTAPSPCCTVLILAGRINLDVIWHLSLWRVEPGLGFLILMLWDI